MSEKTLTKADIVDNISMQLGKPYRKAKELVESLLKLSKKAIAEEGSLLISGLGKFETFAKTARRGRNPQTSDPLILSARKVLVFRLSNKFRAAINE